MKADHIVSIIAVLAILIMGGIVMLGVLYPHGILPNNTATATVTASGSASAVPQQAVITLYINSTGQTSAIATANLSLALLQINSTLQHYTNASSITTQYYSLWKMYNSSLYVASEYVQVQLGNVNNVTPALQALSTYKGVFVSNVAAQLSASQTKVLTSQALQKAVSNATDQAEALTGNATLAVRNISTSVYRSIVPLPYALSAATSGGNGAGTLFFSGQETITENVQVTFAYSR